MPATGQKIRSGDIAQGAPQTLEAAWRAVAELESRFNSLLAKLDTDAADTTLDDTDYAATLGTAAASRVVVD